MTDLLYPRMSTYAHSNPGVRVRQYFQGSVYGERGSNWLANPPRSVSKRHSDAQTRPHTGDRKKPELMEYGVPMQR